MNSTQKSIVAQEPFLNTKGICGRFLRYPPKHDGCRNSEGGLRLRGQYKKSYPQKPLVSIITVVYNRVNKLERALKSVLNQTYDNIEYIIIDGGSTDGTVELIKRYQDAIDYYVSEPDDGIYNAMNKGLQLATGDYIGIVNSDDWYADDAVETSIKEILKTSAHYSGAESSYIDSNGNCTYIFKIQHFNELALFSLQPCGHGTMFISKECYDAIGEYDERYQIVADFKMQMQLIKHGFRSCMIPRTIHYFETSGVSNKRLGYTIFELQHLLMEFDNRLSEQEAESIIYLTWQLPFHKKRLEDIRGLISKPYYNEKQKTYLRDALIEKLIWEYKNDIIVDSEKMFERIAADKHDEDQIATDDIQNTGLYVCGKYWRYPDLTGKRNFEGGLRLLGKRKQSYEKKPLVSIITVVYNGANKLERAIQSVLKQTYENIEYIIIDGGSTDGTIDTIRKYEGSIDYYISEPDHGIYDAMNKGLSLASGEFIGILNSDDWYTPDAVEISIAEILRTSADYSGADEIVVDENGFAIGNYGIRHFDEVAIFSLNPCNHGAMFIHKKIYDDIGEYDTSYKIAADLKYQLSIVLRGYNFCIVGQPVHYYELSGISFRDQETAVQEVKRVLKEIHASLTDDEVDSIVRLRYFDEINVHVLGLALKIIDNNEYNEKQKSFLIRRVLEICCNRIGNFQSAQNLASIGIKGHMWYLMKAIKRRLSKELKGTILFRPAKWMYCSVKNLVIKNGKVTGQSS